MDIKEFFNEIFELKDDNYYILLWDLETKRSSWFKRPQEAAQFADGKKNIYVGVGLSKVDRGAYKRYTIDQVDGVPGFVLDIDIQHEHAHKKNNLPKNIEEACSLVKGHGFDPSLIVNTGHGIQAWWLFKEPEIFKDDQERKKIQRLSYRLHNTIKEYAWTNKKLTIDNVSDLSRILRPVGTINHKNNCKPVKVVALQTDGPKFNPDDFDEMLIDYEPEINHNNQHKTTNKLITITKELKEKSKQIVLNPQASPPQEKFAELINVFAPTFWDTWNHDREHDFKEDNTASVYDMSLTNFAVKAGWSDQEIVDLLIAYRRRNNHDLCLQNKQKYIRTIIKAQQKIKEQQNAEIADKASTLAGTIYEDPQETVNGIKAILGVKILKIIKCIGDDIEYEVQVEVESEGKKKIRKIYMTSSMLLNFRLFECKMFDAATVVINPCKKAEWHKVKQLFSKIIVEEQISKYDGFAGEVFQWLSEYLDGEPARNVQDIVHTKQPFFDDIDNRWYIDLNKFIAWASDIKRYKKPKKIMLRAFKKIGLVNNKKFDIINVKGNRSAMKPWKVPNKIADKPDQNQEKDGFLNNVIKI